MGWLALLILEKGQCEGLNTGVSTEKQTPTSFLFPYILGLTAEFWGHRRHRFYFSLFMKKFLISLVMLLNLSVAGLFAQSSLIATLNHEGNISVFYGGYALQQAHKAAKHGDAITLSSGTFMSTNITKAITLRGAGMDVDTLNNVQPTVIAGDFTIQIADSVSQKLMLEGLFSNFTITVKNTVRDARFIKSRFKDFKLDGNSSTKGYLKNCSFLHCKITNEMYFSNNGSDCSFVNSYVRLNNYNKSSLQLTNCIVRAPYSYSLHDNTPACSFTNCIIVGNNNGDYLPKTASAYNCVAVNCSGNNCFRDIPNSSNQHSTYEALFKEYKGTYNEGVTTFELTDEAKTKFLGTDKTQVGIYGGNLPYDPITTNPRITKCNVAAKSTADGKLSVDIEVKGVE